jgi:uncharacterized protein YceK
MMDPLTNYTEEERQAFLLHCGDCKQDKPASAFPKNRARPTSRGFYCKPATAPGRKPGRRLTRRRRAGSAVLYQLWPAARRRA